MTPTPPPSDLADLIEKAAAELGYDLGGPLTEDRQEMVSRIAALVYRERRKAVSDAFGKMYDTGTNHFNATFWDDVEDVLTAMFPSQP